jgi:hypothetical protein
MRKKYLRKNSLLPGISLTNQRFSSEPIINE